MDLAPVMEVIDRHFHRERECSDDSGASGDGIGCDETGSTFRLAVILVFVVVSFAIVVVLLIGAAVSEATVQKEWDLHRYIARFSSDRLSGSGFLPCEQMKVQFVCFWSEEEQGLLWALPLPSRESRGRMPKDDSECLRDSARVALAADDMFSYWRSLRDVLSAIHTPLSDILCPRKALRVARLLEVPSVQVTEEIEDHTYARWGLDYKLVRARQIASRTQVVDAICGRRMGEKALPFGQDCVFTRGKSAYQLVDAMDRVGAPGMDEHGNFDHRMLTFETWPEFELDASLLVEVQTMWGKVLMLKLSVAGVSGQKAWIAGETDDGSERFSSCTVERDSCGLVKWFVGSGSRLSKQIAEYAERLAAFFGAPWFRADFYVSPGPSPLVTGLGGLMGARGEEFAALLPVPGDAAVRFTGCYVDMHIGGSHKLPYLDGLVEMQLAHNFVDLLTLRGSEAMVVSNEAYLLRRSQRKEDQLRVEESLVSTEDDELVRGGPGEVLQVP